MTTEIIFILIHASWQAIKKTSLRHQ